MVTAGPETDQCELCLRQAPRYTAHHLVPRARGGSHGPKAKLCPTCHRQLHAMFTEATLARELYSIVRLRSNPEVHQYLRWVRRQQGATSFRVRRSSVRQ
jgi:5-methylcytosine-specific restriction protein A